LWEGKLLPPTLFGTSHDAPILLVIHADQVQHTVKHQNLYLFRDGMTKLGGLFSGTLRRNRHFSYKPTASGGWKG
jgi:hypothetical protein